ncbi:MAG TPA: outer membrane beta-barrel protein [Xanthobacteraceae bacterium]
MLRLRSSRLARVAGAAALLGPLVGSHAWAQAVPPEEAENLRPGIDENLQEPGPARVEAPRRPALPSWAVRKYGQPPGSGAGRTGYISTNGDRRKLKAGASEPQAAANGPGLIPKQNFSSKAASRRKPDAVRSGKARAGAPAPTPSAGRPPPAGTDRLDPTGQGVAGANPRRPRKPVEDDPFDAVGVRAGAFLLRPAIEVTTGHDSNPARSSGGRGSSLLIVAPELKVNSDWERHELTAKIRGSYTEYPSVPFADRPFVDAKLDARIDVTRDTRIDLQTRYLLSTENPGSPNLQAGLAKLPTYTDVGGTAGIDRRFNRLDVSLKGSIDRFDYQNSLLTDGTSFSNKDRDYNQYGAQARAGYEITPGLKPFVELDADTRVHDVALDRFGFARDSEGFTPKAGTSFEFTRKLTGEISVGYLIRTYQDPRLADLPG